MIQKVIEKVVYGVCSIILLWILASFINVNMYNLPGMDHSYAPWNAFILLENLKW